MGDKIYSNLLSVNHLLEEQFSVCPGRRELQNVLLPVVNGEDGLLDQLDGLGDEGLEHGGEAGQGAQLVALVLKLIYLVLSTEGWIEKDLQV